MNKPASIGIAVAFAFVVFAAPASAGFVKTDSLETMNTTESYISAGIGNALNLSCGIDGNDVGNIGGVCLSVEPGSDYDFTVSDDSGLEVGGEYRFIDGSVGPSTLYCGGNDDTIEVPSDASDNIVLQIFVGGALNCNSVATTGTVTLTEA